MMGDLGKKYDSGKIRPFTLLGALSGAISGIIDVLEHGRGNTMLITGWL
jgi:hypothetical protein